MSKDVRPFLKHIIDECEYLENASRGLRFEDFIKDETLKRAFVRSLEIIGEASRNIPEAFRKTYGHIPWRAMAGLRNILIHEYFGVDYRNVWKIVKDDVPKLKREISRVLEELE